jgi:hypothetical protein
MRNEEARNRGTAATPNRANFEARNAESGEVEGQKQ